MPPYGGLYERYRFCGQFYFFIRGYEENIPLQTSVTPLFSMARPKFPLRVHFIRSGGSR
jgi:hypothetical protein